MGLLQYYILQKAWPHYVGLIITNPMEGVLLQVPVSGYKIHIAFAGTIGGNLIPAFMDIQKEIEAVFHDMARWFYENRILQEPKKYQKWKL